jgi:hypothetical protein
VLAEGNYEIRVEGENLVLLCIMIQTQLKYIKHVQYFSRISSVFVKLKHGGQGNMCKESINDEENGKK